MIEIYSKIVCTKYFLNVFRKSIWTTDPDISNDDQILNLQAISIFKPKIDPPLKLLWNCMCHEVVLLDIPANEIWGGYYLRVSSIHDFTV